MAGKGKPENAFIKEIRAHFELKKQGLRIKEYQKKGGDIYRLIFNSPEDMAAGKEILEKKNDVYRIHPILRELSVGNKSLLVSPASLKVASPKATRKVRKNGTLDEMLKLVPEEALVSALLVKARGKKVHSKVFDPLRDLFGYSTELKKKRKVSKTIRAAVKSLEKDLINQLI